VSAQPPTAGPPNASESPPSETMRCPRCSATIAAEQDWCLECGVPARTRLAPTPKWQVPTALVAVVVLIAGALLAFAFVKLTRDDATTVSKTAPVVAPQPTPAPTPTAVPPAGAPTTTTQTRTATAPSRTPTTAPPTTVPGQPPAAGAGTTTPKTTTDSSPRRVPQP